MKTNETTSHQIQPRNEPTPPAQNRPPARQRLRQWALLAVALTLFPAVWTQAGAVKEDPRHGHKSQPFSRLFVFGDSLSDTGNLFRLSGGVPPPPYFEGRFSNGHVWVEYLADALDMEIADGDNYAVGGATTGFINSNNGLNGRDYPGLQGEVAEFEATRSAAEAQGALFTVWAGANDFFAGGQTPAQLIGNGVSNTVQAIQRLSQAGARYIIVVNLPDLGLTPRARRANAGAALTQLSAMYNLVLESALDDLASAGIPTIRVDAFTTLRQMVTQPAQFGFTDVTDPLIEVGGNPAQFLFWDDIHPTTAGHAVFAEAAADSLISYFSPRRGKGTPPALINSLNGLVKAWDHN